MKKEKIFIVGLVTAALMVLFAACDNDYPDSVWDEDDEGKPTPVITSISPADSALEGVQVIEINGENFSTEENLVFFNATLGTVISATSTKLLVQTPAIISDESQNYIDSVRIRIAARGAYYFGEYLYSDSSRHPYRLKRAAIVYSGLDGARGGSTGSNAPYALDCDKDGNLYVACAKVIYKITPNGLYGADTTAIQAYSAVITGLKVGWNGNLYFLRNNKNIYTTTTSGGTPAVFAKTNNNVSDLDFDQNGVMWAAGKGDSVYAVTSAKVVKGAYVYTNFTINAVRVFNGYVYFGGTYAGTDPTIPTAGIWRHAITGTGILGDRELYFDWANYSGKTGDIETIIFDEDGNLYVGAKETYNESTDPKTFNSGGTALTKISSDGAAEPFYSSVLTDPVNYTAFYNNYLYIIRSPEASAAASIPTYRIIRAEFANNGAPAYGRNY